MSDEEAVRERFIELLRERTPDHPWVKTHDEQRRVKDITDYVEQTCAECPPVWQYSCACNGWCVRTGEALPD